MKTFLKTALFLILLSALAPALLIPVANVALKNEGVRNSLLQRLAESMHGELQAGKLSIGVDGKSVHIRSTDLNGSLLNNTLMLRIPHLRARFTFSDLLQGLLFPDTLQTGSARISYTPKPLSSSSPSRHRNWGREFNLLLNEAVGHGARIDITDSTLDLAGVTLAKLTVLTVPGNTETELTLKGDLLRNGSVIGMTISGRTENQLFSPAAYDFNLQIEGIPLQEMPSSKSFVFSGGTASYEGKLTGSGEDIRLAGLFRINSPDMSVIGSGDHDHERQKKRYLINHCSLSLQGGLQGRKIDFPSIRLQADDFTLNGSFLFDLHSPENPFLDLRLRSDEMKLATLKRLLPDPLIHDWTTRTIFPRFKNGTARMDNLTLTGTIGEIQQLHDPKHAHCLSWSGVLRNVDTLYNEHLPPAKVHSARLSMEGDLLEISGISAQSETSTLSNGSITLAGLYGSAPTLTTGVNGSFSLAWLKQLVRDGLPGSRIQQVIAPVSTLSGQVDGAVDLVLDLAHGAALTRLTGNGSVSRVTLEHTRNPFPLQIEKGSLVLAYPGSSKISGRGSWGESTFTATVQLVDLKKIKISMESYPSINQLKTLLPENRTLQTLAPCLTALPVQAEITLNGDTLSSSGSLDFSRAVSSEYDLGCKQLLAQNLLTKATYALTYDGRTVTFRDTVLYSDREQMKASGSIDLEKSPRLNMIRLQAADFPVQTFNILLPRADKLINGRLDMDVNSTTVTKGGIWKALEGSLALKGWQGSLTEPAVTVNNLNLTASLHNGMLTLDGKDIRLAGYTPQTPLTLQADLYKRDKWHGTVRLYGDHLDITSGPSLFRKGKTDLRTSLPIDTIRIIAGVDQVQYRNLLFSPLLLQGNITADRVVISKCLLQQEKNFIWLTGDLREDTVTYETYFQIYEKPVDSLLAMMGFDNNIIKGNLDMEGKLTAQVKPGETVFETATGPIYFEIKEGTLESSSTLIQILDLISLQNIFDKTDILKWKNRFAYSLIRGRFDLANSILTTDSLMMNAPAFDIFAEGSFDTAQDNLDMQVKLAPFGTISRLFSSIPFLGFVLTGKTRSLFDYTLSVTGKLALPDVRYIPLVNTFSSLTGYVKRIVSSREEVKKEVSGSVQEDMNRKKSFILRMNNELIDLKNIPAQPSS